MDELHPLEKKVLLALGGLAKAEVKELERECGLAEVEVMRAVQWLQSKNLISVSMRAIEIVELLDKQFKFPERELLEKLAQKEIHIQEADKVAVGWLIRKKWASIEQCILKITESGKKARGEKSPEEEFYEFLKTRQKIQLKELSEEQKKALELLKQRPKVVRTTVRTEREIELTGPGKILVERGISLEEEAGQLTHEHLKTGSYEKLKFRKYDLTAPVPKIYPGKRHPLRAMIDRIREIFLEMGFTEASGPYVESAFWNFDALFQPQDHPARELADTFYLKNPSETKIPKEYVQKVRAAHENGGGTGSTGWEYAWKEETAKKAVLRTHTTAVSARYLAKIKPPAKIFCLGRVFRNETVDYKHLAEFHQVEGIVADENVTFRDLLGYLKEFYNKLGFEKVRFRPAYFPYTEMSVEPEVYFEERKEWIELGGAGIFRPEVTEPFGIKCPVLAWGLGLERPIMLRQELKDIRTFYTNDLGWIRNSPQA